MIGLDAGDAASFVARFGDLFEHSPWVVERAAARRPVGDVDGLMGVFASILDEAGEAAQVALLCAHPELAGKAAIDRTLTQASAAEQAGAGLDRLTEEEFALFHERNAAYRARFGFPFVICVRLTDKAGILDAMSRRLGNDSDTERAAGIAEVLKIVRLRLTDRITCQSKT